MAPASSHRPHLWLAMYKVVAQGGVDACRMSCRRAEGLRGPVPQRGPSMRTRLRPFPSILRTKLQLQLAAVVADRVPRPA